MDFPSDDHLDEFLKKVEEVESIVKGLNTDDSILVKENLDKADRFLNNTYKDDDIDSLNTKTGVNRSCINKYTDDDLNSSNNQNLSQDAFLAALEKDANERYERKKKMTILANELKERGNKEFKNKNYDKAIEYYTEALQKVKDIPVIYTNRAQAYNFIGKYNEAISDCNWALRIDEKCTKAMIHKAKALSFMKEFDKALIEFQNAKNIDSKQSSVIDDYIKELERSRLANNQEEAAKIFLDNNKNGNSSVNNILEILNKKLNLIDQSIWYYSGGLRCLGSLCNDETTRTLFRTQNGFKLFEEHPTFSNLLNDCVKLKNLNTSEIDILCSVFEFFILISKNCDENMRSIFKIKNFSFIMENILKQLNSNEKLHAIDPLKLGVINFIQNLSENEFGLIQLLNNFKQYEILMSLVKMITQETNDIDIKIANLVQNLILEEKFQMKLTSENIKSILEKICLILKEQKAISIKNYNFLSYLFTCIYALTSQKKFLEIIKDYGPVWTECVKFLDLASSQKEKYEILSNVLTCLLNNICAFKSTYLDSNIKKIMENSLKSSDVRNQQVLSLISNLIQNMSERERIEELFKKSFIQSLIENIKSKICVKHSVKVLALLTQNNKNFRKQLIELDPNLNCLYDEIFKDVSQTSIDESSNRKSFNLKKLNEIVINNSVLCISYCVESDQNLVQRLIDTNIMMDLLYLTRDGYNSEMQKNCGILIAKLAKKDEKHLNRLRELNGIEILYAALKNANI